MCSIKYKISDNNRNNGLLIIKNGPTMMSCVCSECGATKTRFVKSNTRMKKGGNIDNWYPMEIYTDVTDPTNPLYQRGEGLDIHNAILKIAPKKGFVMPGHKYTGPGNPLDQQLKYDPNTGEILEIYQEPTGKTDAVS